MIVADALPLAAARNAAARAAHGERHRLPRHGLHPGARSWSPITPAFLAELDGLLMGEVLYLPGGATDRRLAHASGSTAIAVRHSDRRGPPAAGHRALQRLSLLLVAQLRDAARDVPRSSAASTSAMSAMAARTPISARCSTRPACRSPGSRAGCAYHQYHPHHMPPVHHLDSVVRNAELFEAKWGYRTMGHWLYAFRLMGLIDDTAGPADPHPAPPGGRRSRADRAAEPPALCQYRQRHPPARGARRRGKRRQRARLAAAGAA